jgi:hypothetical protein
VEPTRGRSDLARELEASSHPPFGFLDAERNSPHSIT